MKKVLILALVLGWGSLSQAEKAPDPIATCKMGANVRRVQIMYAQEGRKTPCQVLYLKDTEKPGKIEIIFEAQTSGSLCPVKAQAFLERLRGMGWACEGQFSSEAKKSE